MKLIDMTNPYKPDAEQVKRYEQDILRQFPELHLRSYLIYIAGNKGFTCFEVT